jgi:2-dehydro-3-deoxyphosphooctonate aldolase (KDO 8-P synthase)
MTRVNPVRLAEGIEIGDGRPLVVIAGPCVMESYEVLAECLDFLKAATEKRGVPFVFKSSYDKANRTSAKSFRGPGLEGGVEWALRLKRERGPFALLLDVHNPGEAARAAAAADVLQVPAFLCRQTDFIADVARAGRPVNIKKGQFVSPGDVPHIVGKAREAGNPNVTITERGSSFGYNNLVVDAGDPLIRSCGVPVIFDATHAVRCRAAIRATRAACARPCAPSRAPPPPAPTALLRGASRPRRALCDGPNMIDFRTFEPSTSASPSRPQSKQTTGEEARCSSAPPRRTSRWSRWTWTALTDRKIHSLRRGRRMKSFHVTDGLGINLARGGARGRLHHRTLVARSSAPRLGGREVHQDVTDKARTLEEAMRRHGLEKREVAYIGDDVNDLPAFGAAGLKIAVANAHPYVRKAADFVTETAGGQGAVREVIDHILRKKGVLDKLIEEYFGGI